MRKILASVVALVFLLSLGAWAFAADTKDAEKAAEQAALPWLGLIDREQYAPSYQAAAEMFKRSVTSEQWVQALNAVRKPLGLLQTRRLDSAAYKTALPGAPDGEYVVMTFKTSFTGKKEAVETVTFAKDHGVWRAAGYFIR